MTRLQKKISLTEETFNPFNPVDNSELLKSNLNEIDARSIRRSDSICI